MAYIIEFYEKAIADIEKHKASGQKQLVKKIAILTPSCLLRRKQAQENLTL